MEKRINQLDNFQKIRKKVQFINSYRFASVDPYAADLIARMTAAGEPPSAGQAAAINTCIVSLRLASLFETQYDVLKMHITQRVLIVPHIQQVLAIILIVYRVI